MLYYFKSYKNLWRTSMTESLNRMSFMQSVKLFPHLILWKQTFFSLPWVVIAAILPYLHGNITTFNPVNWALMILAFCFARFSGMCFNRLIDYKIDALNPRTCNRALPKEQTTPLSVCLQACLWLALFFLCMFYLNPLCFCLSPIVAFLVIGYSFTKRFTYLCHFIFGCIQSLVPVFAWIAITGSFAWTPIFLGSALGFSMTANDIIYAIQDMNFDRTHHIFSVPARFGKENALRIARILHACSISCLILVGYLLNLTIFYYSGCAIIGTFFVLCYRQLANSPADTVIFDKTFTLSNTYSGMILLLFTLGEFLWHVL